MDSDEDIEWRAISEKVGQDKARRDNIVKTEQEVLTEEQLLDGEVNVYTTNLMSLVPTFNVKKYKLCVKIFR